MKITPSNPDTRRMARYIETRFERAGFLIVRIIWTPDETIVVRTLKAGRTDARQTEWVMNIGSDDEAYHFRHATSGDVLTFPVED